MKRILALALVIVLCVGAIPVSASAATTSLPTISTSCYIKCYPLSSTTLYTNTGLTKTYKTIDKTTCCYIVGISTSYVKVRLSTSGTTYYAKPSAFSSGTLKNKTAIATYTATTSVSTYRQKAATTSYGTIDKGDKVYLLYEPSNSEWIQVLYPINSGKQYYMGWCKTGELYTGALTVSKTSATLSAKGKTTTVTASFPSELGLTVTWTTSDSSIATVTTKSTTSSSSTATVTAKTSTNGKTATITAKFYNGTSVVAKKTMTVTVGEADTWQMPMKNATCSWGDSYTNGTWSWGGDCTTWGRDNGNGRNYHIGVDLVSSDMTVYAAASGTVKKVGNNSVNGYYVIIKHTINGKTVYSFYAHLASYSVSIDQTVTVGQEIGEAGNSGSAASGGVKHLHFAIIDSLSSGGGYYGYATYFSGNKVEFKDRIYYNPIYVITYNKLPS